MTCDCEFRHPSFVTCETWQQQVTRVEVADGVRPKKKRNKKRGLFAPQPNIGDANIAILRELRERLCTP